MAARLLPRITPPIVFGRRGPMRLFERNLLVYRHQWIIILSGFFEPLFYLLAIGVGVGKLVTGVAGPGVSYTAYVAPGLLAVSAMNGAVFDATMNIFHKLKFARIYDGVLSTPLGSRDVALGEIMWALFRGLLYSVAFVITMLALGLVHSWWAIFAIPLAALIGFTFAAVGFAGTTFMRTWADFDIVHVIQLPMFLFSAVFYPLSTFPRPLQLLVEAMPLYHGVTLMRSLTLGTVHIGQLGDVAYLVILGLVGLRITARRLDGLLLR